MIPNNHEVREFLLRRGYKAPGLMASLLINLAERGKWNERIIYPVPLREAKIALSFMGYLEETQERNVLRLAGQARRRGEEPTDQMLRIDREDGTQMVYPSDALRRFLSSD